MSKRQPRRCVFCGANKVTREHVWPRWIGDVLEPHARGLPYKVSRLGTGWDAPKIDMTVKRVCRQICNAGWMGQMEDGIQPILTPMILGNVKSLALSQEERRLLACWALKTALMADFMYPTPLIPSPWYSGFFTHRHPPDQCVIWTTAYGGGSAAVHLHRAPAELLTSPDNKMLAPQKTYGFLVTFNIFRVVFQVLGSDGDYLPPRTSPTDAHTHRLWPSHRGPLNWPPHGRALSDTALSAFAYRTDFL